jgi:hypothetical protein
MLCGTHLHGVLAFEHGLDGAGVPLSATLGGGHTVSRQRGRDGRQRVAASVGGKDAGDDLVRQRRRIPMAPAPTMATRVCGPISPWWQLCQATLPGSHELPSKTLGTLLIRDWSTSRRWEADLMQAAYFLERLGLLRFEAEASRAKLYVDLQRIVNAGELTRACDLRGLLCAKEAEVVTHSTVWPKQLGIASSRCVPGC